MDKNLSRGISDTINLTLPEIKDKIILGSKLHCIIYEIIKRFFIMFIWY